MTQLVLKRASASRPSGEWGEDDYDVLADGVVVGRIFHAAASPEGAPWMWTLADGHHIHASAAYRRALVGTMIKRALKAARALSKMFTRLVAHVRPI
jgi:hypothetical protein